MTAYYGLLAHYLSPLRSAADLAADVVHKHRVKISPQPFLAHVTSHSHHAIHIPKIASHHISTLALLVRHLLHTHLLHERLLLLRVHALHVHASLRHAHHLRVHLHALPGPHHLAAALGLGRLRLGLSHSHALSLCHELRHVLLIVVIVLALGYAWRLGLALVLHSVDLSLHLSIVLGLLRVLRKQVLARDYHLLTQVIEGL